MKKKIDFKKTNHDFIKNKIYDFFLIFNKGFVNKKGEPKIKSSPLESYNKPNIN